MDAAGPTYSAPALEKGLDILDLLAEAPEGLGQSEIARALDRSVGEIFRMLEVLVRRGWIARGPDQLYRLTLRMFEMAHRHPPTNRLLAAALPVMRGLSAEVDQSAHLSVHHDDRILVIAQVEAFSRMALSVRLGSSYPFTADRVSPRVLTAFQPDDQRQRWIAEIAARDPRPGALQRVRRDVARIRADGRVLAPSTMVDGVTDVCFPVIDAGGGAVAALVVPYLKMRDAKLDVSEVARLTGEAARAISASLGAPATDG
jgi:DNA-binding IclR family transcriptional regulator